MALRSVIFGFALAAFEAARGLFHSREPEAVIHFLQDVQRPPYFYIKIDEQVFAVKLSPVTAHDPL